MGNLLKLGEIDNYIPEFREKFDPDVDLVGHDLGEFGFAMAILCNRKKDIWYYLQLQRVWFDSFGSKNKDYHTKLPTQDRGAIGTSIQFKTLAQAWFKTEYKSKVWIVILKQQEHIWYACNAKKWYSYVTAHETFFKKDKSQIDSRIEGGIPLRLLTNVSEQGSIEDLPFSGPLDSFIE